MKRLFKISLLLLVSFSLIIVMGCNASKRGCGCAANVHAIGMIIVVKKLNNKI
jgi:hypothetical protein